ncbi:MAG: translation initiation factor aIF-1A [Sulfolobales archaeon]|nr:translation initiation factor aIF-1A [Sulfolobales archaeon]MCQ4336633.1 translation initiation factor aIF-1A [Sulfolobales archaeon]MCQ4449321.1 translation initiation factor aIF-1A [Sulfolobales archaeon]
MTKKRAEQSQVKELRKPEPYEVICVVKKLLGAEHVQVLCLDGKERMGRIPGKYKKRMWIKEGDVVIVQPWDFQPNKCDVVYRYEDSELRKLVEEGIVDKDLLEQLRG